MKSLTTFFVLHLKLGAADSSHFSFQNCLPKYINSQNEGYYQGGKFQFETEVPDAYNMVPPRVKCLTKIWHPNITETGEICLSLLREHSIDGTGWAPTRTLKDVVWGLNSLFTDLLNFDDPLNIEAAEHHLRDKEDFRDKVDEYIKRYAR
ncbi:hypothetical protein U0070_007955 [Myodes glareolus]|uniref:E2 NEDD8-conjugating enzyme n=1 Tax=Myodes glareolus TaxID=447135 RepID=A0AAW0IGS3_MYOGA